VRRDKDRWQFVRVQAKGAIQLGILEGWQKLCAEAKRCVWDVRRLCRFMLRGCRFMPSLSGSFYVLFPAFCKKDSI